ncbi:MAG TPA: DUF2116 family Zn-ribbon domain-containing protein [Methanomassiliicoccales archaeon]|nr:DUF2116 family Zn-ribbon domain-containing protein [Methanomassiliicoccales archaeon]
MSLLPEHSHCLNCDEPVDEGQEYCSEECKAIMKGEQQKERNRNMFMFAIVAVVLIAITLLVSFG